MKTHLIGLFLAILYLPLVAQTPMDERAILFRNPLIQEAGQEAELIFKAEQAILINLDSALLYAEVALQSAQRKQNSKATAVAYVHMAHIYIRKGEYRSALEYINLAQIINDYTQSEMIGAALHYAKARLFLSVGNTLSASKEAMSALSVFESYKDSLNLARVYNFLGGVYSEIEETEKAIEYNVMALRIQQSLNLIYYNASSYSNLGVSMLNVNNLDSAVVLVYHAISLNRKADNQIWLANNYHLLGLIYKQMNQQDSALIYFQHALNTHRNYGSAQGEASLLVVLGNDALHTQDYLAAQNYYQAALEIAEARALLSPKISCYQGLSAIAEKEGSGEQALLYYKQYKYHADSLKKMQNVSVISMMELEKELEQNRLQQKVAAEESELKQRKKNFFIFLLIGIVVVLGVVLYLIWIWNRLRRTRLSVEKEELNRAIEHKNKELTLSVMTQVKRNETVLNLVKTLEKGVQDIDIKEKRKITSLIKELKQEKDDTVWEEFELRFKNVYNDFYSRLRSDYPDLTLPEIKICAFLRMGLNTKEISSLLYKSQSSIEVDRARIRKKMGLTNTPVNLNAFLADL